MYPFSMLWAGFSTVLGKPQASLYQVSAISDMGQENNLAESRLQNANHQQLKPDS